MTNTPTDFHRIHLIVKSHYYTIHTVQFSHISSLFPSLAASFSSISSIFSKGVHISAEAENDG